MRPPPATPASRHRTASEQVGAALLDAAQAVLDREGLAAVSVRAVAIEAGVAPMGVYNRFQNKDGLLVALAVRAFDALHAAVDVEHSGEAPGDPLQRLRQSCRAYRTFALRHPEQYHLMFSGVSSLASPSPAAKHGTAVLQVLVDTIDSATRQGILHAAEPVEAAQMVWNAIHGAVTLELASLNVTLKRHGFEPADTYDKMLDVLIDGLRRP
ncbi:AcrR family transcriptional regulator [Acrocarpospora pleiomorpha]|uniref:AcrR family transcriptional regulator n=1 Tax=Acrocarpospora pleiomorpha TaxID=90975 RepID=A0A5M3XE55_9ACTN|nr:TetR/AcrR family transcriptional regulator [Acrocarpospora pleiomorpha]GES17193.1 AcrR family transcriptional regulator [Acrocarpospora pleiomorpha]